MKYYKIRNNEGQFSTGGSIPRFSKTGKIWTLPTLKSHLRLLQHYTKNFNIYRDCELVTYTEIIEPATISLTDLLQPLEEELMVTKLKGKS